MASIPDKVRILFIEASPRDQQQLDSGTERARMEDALWASLNPEVFDVAARSAVHSHDIESSLRRRQPQVIHFSGHGNRWGELILNAPDDATSHPLSGEDFAEKLRRYTEHAPQAVRLVILAGCYTEPAAQLVSEFVDCAIGMADAVGDGAMVDVFTPTLYRALGDGYSVGAAVAEAQQELRIHPDNYVREADAVRLHTRQGVDPAKWKLTELAASVPALSQAHLKYLHALFKQRWATVKLKLFDPKTAQEVDLLDIYSPLPVDFAITLELDDRGVVRNWWCAREDKERREREELEPWAQALLEFPDRRTLTDALPEHKVRPRNWTDLQVNEGALQPLIEVVRGWASGQKDERHRETKAVHWQAEAEHAALVQRRFVLIGDPGSGKSTFLRHLALSWAALMLRETGETRADTGACLDAGIGWTGPAFTPVYIELRPLVETFPALPPGEDLPQMPNLETFETYLTGQLARMKCEPFCDDLSALLRAGRAAILLDGLDEVSDADDHRRRTQMQAFVSALHKAFNQAPIIVTARPYAYRPDSPSGTENWELAGFGHTALVPFEPERQIAMARRIFACLRPGDDRRAKEFVAALDSIPKDLPGNPLLLTLLAAVSVRRPSGELHALPKTRGELYDRALKLLLEDWVREHNERFRAKDDIGLDSQDLRLALQLVARRAQERSTQPNQAVIIERTDFYGALDDIGKGETTPKLVKHLQWTAGMLLDLVEQTPGAMTSPEPGRFRFLHLSFQEYLAACDMLYRPETAYARPRSRPGRVLWDERPFPDMLAAQVRQKPRLWANVLRLAVDELLAKGRVPEAWELLARCCQPYRERGEDALAALLALQVTLDADLFTATRPWGVQEFYQTLQDAAMQALRDHRPDDPRSLSPEQRDIAGKLLGSDPFPGHDPRAGVGVKNDLPDIAWAPIPDDGEFTYQEDERRTEPIFWIAKYPITYAQFQAFLDAKDGFYNPEWWEKPTRLATPQGHRDAPGEQAFKHWNHPRERVSWYDAIAFCRWLTAQVKAKVDARAEGCESLLPFTPVKGQDWQITLPTEWQWEKAARGPDGRIFPWGGKELDDYKRHYVGQANIDETWSGYQVGPHYLQKTSAVGMYPQGASPYGVLDMSGNVWEWCLNEYAQPERIQEEGDAYRVLRGGSWNFNVGFASALARDYDWYAVRDYFIGFRVVVVGGVPL